MTDPTTPPPALAAHREAVAQVMRPALWRRPSADVGPAVLMEREATLRQADAVLGYLAEHAPGLTVETGGGERRCPTSARIDGDCEAPLYLRELRRLERQVTEGLSTTAHHKVMFAGLPRCACGHAFTTEGHAADDFIAHALSIYPARPDDGRTAVERHCERCGPTALAYGAGPLCWNCHDDDRLRHDDGEGDRGK